MKLEIIIAGITLFFIANAYYDGKLVHKMKSFQKYYKIAFLAFVGLCVYLYIKKNPANSRDLLANANSYIKYMPIDRQTTSFIAPIIDFTGRTINETVNNDYPNLGLPNNNRNYTNLSHQQRKILSSGNKSTKRSVSETKKKYVAANQGWICKHCNKQLPAWFEIDHVVKLEYGGSNNIDNLEALCRDCHGKKTALENL